MFFKITFNKLLFKHIVEQKQRDENQKPAQTKHKRQS